MIEKLLEAIAADPTNPFYKYGIAIEYRNSGEADKAMKYFSEVHDNAPEYLPNYFHYGQLLVDFEELQQAQSIFEEGIKLAKRQGNSHALAELQGSLSALLESENLNS
ncbi:MAG: hypothetical protein KDD62_04090 [Bdellovibrionales bacterium]|nr:hypothetical protein [Bdellovibrionales bacterium]